MKKGFTLIELLAVIVILAIIALIATPIVLNIIKDTKESALYRSGEFYYSALEQSVATAKFKNINIKNGTYSIMKDGNLCIGTLESNTCSGDILKVNVKGDKPTSGSITFEDGKIIKTILKISDKEIVKNLNSDFIHYFAPGLYDKKDKLIASWNVLVEKYDFKTLIETGGTSSSLADIINMNFRDATKLVIHNSVTSIGDLAFWGLTNLTSITIPDSVTSIGAGAFAETGLTSVTIPDSVTSIGDFAFAQTSLTSITIPDSVTSIGLAAFEDTGLTSIKVESNNPIYDSRDNSNAIIETATNTLIAGCKTTIIPSTITSIGDFAFAWTSLTSITIPESVTSIGDSAFYGCSSLTRATIPESVTSIGDYAFSWTNLGSITIPESVTSIGTFTFESSGLTSITIPKSVTSIGAGAFLDCSSLKTIYYRGTADEWDAMRKADSWDERTPSNKTINYNYNG